MKSVARIHPLGIMIVLKKVNGYLIVVETKNVNLMGFFLVALEEISNVSIWTKDVD